MRTAESFKSVARRPRKRAWSCAIAFLGSLSVAEFAIRWADPPTARRGFTNSALRAGRIGLMLQPSPDPELYFELIPGLVTTFQGHRVVIGDDGYVRAGPESTRLEGEPLRIAVLGASSAFGFGIASADAWPERLRSRLTTQFGIEVELRNFCVPGYNTRQQVRVFERDALPWSPDVILWHYDHRDVFPVLGKTTEFVMPDSIGDNPLRSHLIRFVVRDLHRRRVESLRPEDEHPRTHGFYPIEGIEYDRHLDLLDRALLAAGAQGIPIVMVLFDSYLEASDAPTHYETLHRGLVARWRKHGAAVVDLFPRLVAWMNAEEKEDLRDLWVSRDPPNPHPSVEYSQKLADWVFEDAAAELTKRKEPKR